MKNLYDITDMKILFSGSSKIKIQTKSYDLSRRVVLALMSLFAYYEFVDFMFKKKITFSFEEIITNHHQIAFKILHYIDKDVLKEQYLKYGEFWYFYQWFKDDFNFLLENSLKKSIYEDLPHTANIESKNLNKIEKLLFFIANMWASEISTGSLAKKYELIQRQ